VSLRKGVDVCWDCRNPPAAGGRRCALCTANNRQRTRLRYERQKKSGLRWTR
jgi:hypothetical protein